MRMPALSFLLLAVSLPAFAHHDRGEREHRREWRHRPVMAEAYGPRFVVERPPTPPWARPRAVLRERHPWVVLLPPPPPPVIVRPSLRLWIGF